MNTNETSQEMVEFLKAFAHADRLRIAGLVGVEALSANQLAQRLKISLRQVVENLTTLQNLGLVQQKGEIYFLDEKALQALARKVLSGSRSKAQMEDLPADEYERKVISDFSLPDGSFKTFPTQQKKFLAILRYIVRVFEPGMEYPEKQVNAMLLRFNEDTATLRRGLVDYNLMQRQAGVYKRI